MRSATFSDSWRMRDFEIADVEGLRAHYALTLRAWVSGWSGAMRARSSM